MGQEMPYRYQEHLMWELLEALRSFAARIDEQSGNAASTGRSSEPHVPPHGLVQRRARDGQ
jgi:hypothetical protein